MRAKRRSPSFFGLTVQNFLGHPLTRSGRWLRSYTPSHCPASPSNSAGTQHHRTLSRCHPLPAIRRYDSRIRARPRTRSCHARVVRQTGGSYPAERGIFRAQRRHAKSEASTPMPRNKSKF